MKSEYFNIEIYVGCVLENNETLEEGRKLLEKIMKEIVLEFDSVIDFKFTDVERIVDINKYSEFPMYVSVVKLKYKPIDKINYDDGNGFLEVFKEYSKYNEYFWYSRFYENIEDYKCDENAIEKVFEEYIIKSGKDNAYIEPDAYRISYFIRKLEEAWSIKPDLRFNQLISIINGGEDSFYIEDDVMLNRINEWASKESKKDLD